MQKSQQAINVMGLSLGVLYAITMLIYLETIKYAFFRVHAIVLFLLMLMPLRSLRILDGTA